MLKWLSSQQTKLDCKWLNEAVGKRVFQTPVKIRTLTGAVAVCDKVVVHGVEEVVALHGAVGPEVRVLEPSSNGIEQRQNGDCPIK